MDDTTAMVSSSSMLIGLLLAIVGATIMWGWPAGVMLLGVMLFCYGVNFISRGR